MDTNINSLNESQETTTHGVTECELGKQRLTHILAASIVRDLTRQNGLIAIAFYTTVRWISIGLVSH